MSVDHAPGRIETATFGFGCFWIPDARFGCHPAVVRTRVGYAGGTTLEPTYHDLADHTEVFQLDYDPRRLSYVELLDQLFVGRSTRRGRWRQYMHGIFCADAQQASTAHARGLGDLIVPGTRFHLAEAYHQKYHLRHDSILMQELADLTPAQFVESTIAARLNGYVAGSGTRAQLGDELPRLGLSARARAHLAQLVGHRDQITHVRSRIVFGAPDTC